MPADRRHRVHARVRRLRRREEEISGVGKTHFFPDKPNSRLQKYRLTAKGERRIGNPPPSFLYRLPSFSRPPCSFAGTLLQSESNQAQHLRHENELFHLG